jgi:hypothetical protein
MPDPAKTELIDNYPVPKTVKDARSFVSLASYYRKFVKGFAQIAKPLTNLLEKNAIFHWSEECQQAFNTLKTKLSRQTQLTLPDFSNVFRLACDASGIAVGAVLSQLDDNGIEHPVAFASKVLSKTERNWSCTEREAYAIVWGVDHFRSFLLGRPFQLVSDHQPLRWLRQMKCPPPKLARWILQLEEFDFEITYKPGEKNVNADAMTRPPIVNVNTILTQLESDMTLAEIRNAQLENEDLQTVMNCLKTSSWEDCNSNNILRAFSAIQDELFLDENIIYRQLSDEHCQVILPPMMHSKILMIYHDSPTGGHLGIDRTTKSIQQLFYWPNIRRIVANYISKCLTCEKFKDAKENTTAQLQPIISHQPW